MYRSHFEDIDWVDLRKRLTIRAKSLTRSAEMTFDCGLSYEDLVEETLEAFLESETALGWDPTRGVWLHVFLGRVLENKFVDHVRRQKHVGGSLDDGRTDPRETDPPHDLTYDDFVTRVAEAVKGNTDLEELVLATALIDGGHNVNQQLAEQLKTTVENVVNRKKRLLNNPEVKKLYEQRQKRKQSQP